MGRLLTALCALGTLVVVILGAASAGGSAFAESRPATHVDVISVSGLIDPVQADFITNSVHDAESGRAEVLVIQLNSRGGVLSESATQRLASALERATVPVAVWVGPTGKGRAFGSAFAVLRAAGIAGVANGTHVGKGPDPRQAANPLADRSVGAID